MSIESEITRLQNAKAALKTSINAKGRALTTETIDDYAAEVDLISTGADTSDATAAAGEILASKTAYISSGKTTGTMTNVGAQTEAISAKDGHVHPTAGYHNGSGTISIHADEQAKIIAANIKSGITILGQAGDSNVIDTTNTTDSAASASILSGKKAFVNGALITGNIASKSVATITPTESAQTIDSGQYLSGTQTIAAIPTAYKDMTTTDVAAGDVLSGKKAGNTTGIITGTMANIGAQTGTITAYNGAVTPTQGYHNGSGSVTIHTDEQAKIISANIKSGITILGRAGAANVIDTTNSTDSATAASVLSGKKAFVNGALVTGNITSKGVATITPTESSQTIASGQYLSGTQTISAIPTAYKNMTTTDAVAANILSGKKAGNTTGVITGTMANIGAQTATISTKTGSIAPTTGYHNGSGAITISTAEKDKIIAENIKSGVTILGVAGSMVAQDNTDFINMIEGDAAFTLPAGLTKIGPYKFLMSAYVSSLAIPNTVTVIYTSAFAFSNIVVTKLPTSLVQIYARAFEGCTSIVKIWIPISCTTIGGVAAMDSPFAGCTSTMHIYCQASSKPAGYSTCWNYYDETHALATTYGYSEAQFDALG